MASGHLTDSEIVHIITYALMHDEKEAAKLFGRSLRTVQRYIKKAKDEPQWYMEVSAAVLKETTELAMDSQRSLPTVTTDDMTADKALSSILSYLDASAKMAKLGDVSTIRAMSEAYEKIAGIKLAQQLIYGSNSAGSSTD